MSALKPCPPLFDTHRCGRYPPEVRTAIPVDGRFEHIVLSCNATSDHAIIWIEREADKALEVSFSTFNTISLSAYKNVFSFFLFLFFLVNRTP